jgi:hypothetical protein
MKSSAKGKSVEISKRLYLLHLAKFQAIGVQFSRAGRVPQSVEVLCFDGFTGQAKLEDL